MLELQHVKKYYQVGESTTKALDDVNIAFRPQEFVAILGPSGSGKTTMLNVIGGLDRYDTGDLIINGKSTKNFKDTDWDAYRNNSVGFIFQNYNLIGHLGIIANVELGMTLSGVSSEESHQKAVAALTKVGLKDHMNKKPNQLSGGQMQRVAIARAIANDPDILLCDEPTGALDTETSVQIMELIKELAQEKLVIMVTHNPKLAEQYADRIVRFADGKIQDDTNPYVEETKTDQFQLNRTKMTFLNALKLSMTNILTKKGRTFLTAFASSIGIIGIAIVISLSNGFQKQIDSTQTETLSKFPVTVSQTATDQSAAMQRTESDKNVKNKGYLVAAKDDAEKAVHINKIDQKYIDYVKDINPKYSNNISYTRLTGMNLLREVDGKVQPVSFSTASANSASGASAMQSQMSSMTGVGVSVFPEQLEAGSNNFLKQNYGLLSGSYPTKANEVVLIVDNKNETNLNALNNLGFNYKDGDKINFDKIVGTTVKVISNNDYYTKLPIGNFMPGQDYAKMYSASNLNVKVVGVLRAKDNTEMSLLAPGIAYSDKLTQEIIKANKDSEIVTAQKASATSVLTSQKLTSLEKDQIVASLGGSSIPSSILIYPNNFKDKDKVLDYLDKYNNGKKKADKILYSDLSGTVTKLTGGLLDAITYVLVAFAAISLVTSMIMIGILTYTSVLERTKEIGVLKALGARKKDITRVFDAETFILGVGSGILGILIAYGLTFPINVLLESLTDLPNIAQLDPIAAVVLVVISTILTMIGGHMPARFASKKDAAIALRSE